MKYALGSSFNLDDMFMNFPYKKLKLTCALCLEINGNAHRDILVKKIFRVCLKKVLLEVINDGVTFNLPTGAKKSDIHLYRMSGEEFMKARAKGKFKNVDFLSSLFLGYELSLYMYSNGRTRRKPIYVNKELKDLLTERINNRTLNQKITLKYVADYYEYIKELFPILTRADIKRILNFGFKSLYLHNSYGGDTLVTDDTLWCFIGTLRKDSLKHYMYYIKKLTVKLRVLYKRKRIEWDHYYYFALTDTQYENYLSLKKKRGRPRKYFNYGNLVLYKILDECKIKEFGRKYIFKVPSLVDIGYTQYRENFESGEAELIISREPLKLKDILVTNCKYEYL